MRMTTKKDTLTLPPDLAQALRRLAIRRQVTPVALLRQLLRLGLLATQWEVEGTAVVLRQAHTEQEITLL